MEVMKVQVDLKQQMATMIQAGKSGCQRYKLEALEKGQFNSSGFSQSSLFLVNVLFKYVGIDKF